LHLLSHKVSTGTRRAAAVTVLLFAALVSFVVSAETVDAQDVDQPETISLHTSFDHYWRRYLEAATSGSTETEVRILDEIKRLRVERNTFNLVDLGTSFVYQGLGLLESGEFEAARNNFETAVEVAPDLPTAYWGLARVSEREGGTGYVASGLHRVQARLAAFRSELDGPFASWNLLFVLFAALMALVFLFALLMVYRYGVLLYHEFFERLGDDWGSKATLAATLVALFVPLILTVGVGWLAPYWLAVTFAYQSAKERVVSVLCLLVFLGGAPFAELYSAWSRTVGNPVYQAALSSVTGTFDVGDVEVLRSAIREYPNDRDLQFLLATQYKNLGDYELAASTYRRILDAFPDDLESRLNLGNIYFAQRDWDGALVQYNQAIAANPQFAMAYYNKSLAHAENFQFAEREEARAKAEALNAPAIAAFEQLTGNYRVVADARLDDVDILGKFYGLSEGIHENRVTSFFEPRMLANWGLRFVVGPILFAALIVVLELFFKQRRLTQRCWKCGSAFCGRCQIGTGRKGLCTQCYHLFFMKDGVSAQARNDKLSLVQRAARTKAVVFRALSIIAPGAGHVGEGMSVVGILLLFLWLLGVSALFLAGSLYPFPDGILGLGSSASAAVIAWMAVVFVVANLISRPVVRG
jgi:Tfp pilus assembly protein PilF